MKATFYSSCVNWPRDDVDDGLIPMIESGRDITRATFCRAVNRSDRQLLESSLGYGPDFRIGRDYAVRFKSGLLHGKRVWFLEHSRIEYVFKRHTKSDIHP